MSEVLGTDFSHEADDVIVGNEGRAVELHFNVIDWLEVGQPTTAEGPQTAELIPLDLVTDIFGVTSIGLIANPETDGAGNELPCVSVQVVCETFTEDRVSQFDLYFVEGRNLITFSSFDVDKTSLERTENILDTSPNNPRLASADQLDLLLAWMESSELRPADL